MSTPTTFAELIQRVRAGDQDAAAEVVRRYEPAIRRVVRYRMGDPQVGAVMDSADICQSVLASFFLRAASGSFDLDQPEQLQRLLLAMARNKLAFQVRKQRTQRRDHGGATADALEDNLVPGREATPSRQIAARELLGETQRRLSPEEWHLVQLRQQGLGWDQVAAQVQGSPEALRKKLTRALDRVAQELGLDDWTHE